MYIAFDFLFFARVWEFGPMEKAAAVAQTISIKDGLRIVFNDYEHHYINISIEQKRCRLLSNSSLHIKNKNKNRNCKSLRNGSKGRRSRATTSNIDEKNK